ncbi:MAG TPA: transcription elongation factor subunit Spt4 [Candidatus Nanoarchaeia archaeon]|nr:transcription elongation factor subunit Spt4 [Candidatus Nanoarchaeia archaeon]
MVKKKACKNCKIFVKGADCPLCKSKDLTSSWKGRVIIMDPIKSEIAKKMGIKTKGEYAIKTK